MPDPARDALASAIDAMRPQLESAKWVPAQNLHVTVSFLGSVPDERVDEVTRVLAGVVSGSSRVPTRLAGLGAFPRTTRARVVWAGLDDEDGALADLAARIQTGLAAIGFEPEARVWQAHVTLARLRTPQSVAIDDAVEAVEFMIDRVVLYQSKLQRPAPVYVPISVVPLA